jgi:hypothetical protein
MVEVTTLAFPYPLLEYIGFGLLSCWRREFQILPLGPVFHEFLLYRRAMHCKALLLFTIFIPVV